MTSYKLRACDIDSVRKVASKYAQLDTGYRSFMPVETIGRAYTSK